ncbi:MAG: DnaJ C-terminal domain-containing protein, partial [Acidobacteriota bacterium]
FEQAVFGHETTLSIQRRETCEVCGGSGSASGRRETCSMCGGVGRVRMTQGFFSVTRTCPQCGGMGTVVTDPCEACGGTGYIEREREIDVEIPAGVDTGLRLRLRGKGDHGTLGGPPGDLDVVIQVEPHPRFERDGADVHEALTLHYAQLVLGTSVEIETLHGPETLKIPPGTAIGNVFRLRGQGIPRLGARSGDARGDHVLHVALDVPHPRDLSEERERLLRELAETAEVPVQESGGVFKRVLRKVLD